MEKIYGLNVNIVKNQPMSEITDELLIFKVLEEHKTEFAIAACMALLNFSTDATELIEKQRWYAQICDCICRGDTSTVTDIERIEFVKLHKKLMGWNQ